MGIEITMMDARLQVCFFQIESSKRNLISLPILSDLQVMCIELVKLSNCLLLDIYDFETTASKRQSTRQELLLALASIQLASSHKSIITRHAETVQS